MKKNDFFSQILKNSRTTFGISIEYFYVPNLNYSTLYLTFGIVPTSKDSGS
jgi:hypothetical protein